MTTVLQPLRAQKIAMPYSCTPVDYGLLDTPVGPIGVACRDGYVTRVDLEPETADRDFEDLPTDLVEQFAAYFRDGRTHLDIPLRLQGTPFQERVWLALRSIPPGETRTYGDLARRLGTGARAIGGACRSNPCPILVPCHRVVATSGLGGFAGDTTGRKLEVKRRLLSHEGVAHLPGEPEQRPCTGIARRLRVSLPGVFTTEGMKDGKTPEGDLL